MVYSKNDTSLYLCPKDHSTRKEINCLLTVDAMTAMKKKMLYFLLLLAALLPACGTSQMADSIPLVCLRVMKDYRSFILERIKTVK